MYVHPTQGFWGRMRSMFACVRMCWLQDSQQQRNPGERCVSKQPGLRETRPGLTPTLHPAPNLSLGADVGTGSGELLDIFASSRTLPRVAHVILCVLHDAMESRCRGGSIWRRCALCLDAGRRPALAQ